MFEVLVEVLVLVLLSIAAALIFLAWCPSRLVAWIERETGEQIQNLRALPAAVWGARGFLIETEA